MMFGLIVSICVMIIGAILLKKRNEARLRADLSMSAAVDEMFSNWNTLMDAKGKNDDDVPDELIDLATWLVKCSRTRGIGIALAASLIESRGKRNGYNVKVNLLSSQMREPLQGVFQELIGAWFLYISNKNLFTRLIIRNALGRYAEKGDEFTPYKAQMAQRVAKRKAVPCVAEGMAA